MIEKNLRKWLRPVVIRRKRLMLRKTLSLYWSIAAIAGIMIIIADRLWMWSSPVEILALIAGIIVSTVIAFVKSSAAEPDYKAIARNIEQQNPELRATLLTAIEQEPEKPFGQLGYLQERVISEAMEHAKQHNWVQSISQKTFFMAALGQTAAMIFFIVVLLQLLSDSKMTQTEGTAATARSNYKITVTPGDTTIETGSTVVIEARFDGRVPDEVKLLIGPSQEEMQELPLRKNLEDPVFGRVVPQVNSDMIYHIEYANKNTDDYKITTYEHPLLERADAKIIYPSYTNLPEKIVKDTRRIGVVESSEVTLTFTLNKNVDTAKLVARDGSEIELSMDTENENLYTSPVIIPTENIRYDLKLVDADGRANKVPPRFVIDVHKNLPADLKLTFPSRDIEASPLEELTLQAEVTDDYGVTSYGTSYILAGVEPQDITLGESVPANKKQPVEYILALEDLQVQPDQLLTYFFWADDVGPDGNIRRTVSDLYFTEIRPFEQIFRENQSFMDQNQQQERQQEQQQDMQGEQQQQEELIQLQKQIISATWNVKRQADLSDSIENQKEDLDLVRQSQADALDMARSSSQEGQGQGFQSPFPQLRVMGQRRGGGSPNNDSASADAMEQAAQYMEKALEHLQETLESGTTDELIQALASEQAAYQELLKTRERENEVARDRSAQQMNNMNQSARSQQQLQQLEMRQREDRYETQRQAQEEQTQQREDLQVLNRLRELARRQDEMTDRLREAEASLREAQSEEERDEIRRQLERLQEEQVETLRDMDELQQRMENEQNRQSMSDMSEQLSETRSRIQESAEELEQGNVSDAAAATTRAQRELEEMRDEFQRRTSGQFSEQMRNMREQAQQLDENQREISQEMRQQTDSEEQISLEAGTNQDLADRVQEQRETMENLLEQMREVSEQAENSEPLLSRRLYDTYRQASTENVERSLEATEELLRRNFLPQAQEIEEQAREGIENLREGIEEAARGVLGDEADSLRLAREQLDELINELNEETQANRTGQAGDPNQMGNQQAREGMRGQTGDPNQMENQQTREGMRGQTGDPNQMENQQAREGMRGQPGDQNQQMENQQAREGMRGQPGDQNQQMENQQAREGMRGQQNPMTGERRNDSGRWDGFQELTGPWDEYDPNRPLTGDDFRQWADRLRDVEEILSEQELREEVATVRDRAQTIREEYTRHGNEPQWDVVEMQITKPLNEVRDRVNEELAKLESREAPVPIDRDPVPSRYAELVRAYYENLGGGD